MVIHTGDALAKRLFIALPLPAPVRAEVNSFVHVLKRLAPGVRWVRADHLHITLRFLGDVEEAEELKLITALETMDPHGPFRFHLSGLGAFPDRTRPRVFWTGISSGVDEMTALAAAVEKACRSAGFEPAQRRFSPHVTLGRVRQPGDFSALWSGIERSSFSGKPVNAHQVKLIWSTLTPAGPQYRDVESFPLRDVQSTS